jgi:hypothetical protein
MIAKIAILFTGAIMGPVLGMLYSMAFFAIASEFSLSLIDATFTYLQPVFLVAGYVTTFRLLRGAWSTPPLKKYVPLKNRRPSSESGSQHSHAEPPPPVGR